MRSRGQKPRLGGSGGSWRVRTWLRRACRAQVRQRLEFGGAEAEGCSHLGLNWMREVEGARGR